MFTSIFSMKNYGYCGITGMMGKWLITLKLPVTSVIFKTVPCWLIMTALQPTETEPLYLITTVAKAEYFESKTNEYHTVDIIYNWLRQRTNNLQWVTSIWSTRGCNKTRKQQRKSDFWLSLCHSCQHSDENWNWNWIIATTELLVGLEDADPTAPAGVVDLKSVYKYVTEFLGNIENRRSQGQKWGYDHITFIHLECHWSFHVSISITQQYLCDSWEGPSILMGRGGVCKSGHLCASRDIPIKGPLCSKSGERRGTWIK